MTGSLRIRLLVGAGFFIALGLFVAWFSLQQLFAGHVSAQYKREMQVVVDTLAAGVEFGPDGMTLTDEPADPRFSLPAGGRYWEIEPESGEPLRSRSLWDTGLESATLRPSAHAAFLQGDGPDGLLVLVLRRTLSFETVDGTWRVSIQAAFEAAEMEASLAGFRRQLALMLAQIAAVLLLASFLQVHVGLRPLRLLREEVARVRAGEAARLVSEVPNEVRPLVSEINDLLADRAGALDRARTRASDLAHGLKTPLTAIAQVAETIAPDKGRTIMENVAMIRRRADRQLQRARLGAGHADSSDLAATMQKLVRVIGAIPSDREIAWEVDIPDGLRVAVDQTDLAEALGNILDNARKWAKSRVQIGVETAEGTVAILIADDGPGLGAEMGQRMIERGIHAGDSESETGLGLAISRETVEAYGGVLRLERSLMGGLLVVVELPGARQTRPASSA